MNTLEIGLIGYLVIGIVLVITMRLVLHSKIEIYLLFAIIIGWLFMALYYLLQEKI